MARRAGGVKPPALKLADSGKDFIEQ